MKGWIHRVGDWRSHLSLSLVLNEVGDVPLYNQHVLAHPVEHHHVERDAKQCEEHTEDLARGGAGTHVPITYKTVSC